mgnify:CR=1 FL=1
MTEAINCAKHEIYNKDKLEVTVPYQHKVMLNYIAESVRSGVMHMDAVEFGGRSYLNPDSDCDWLKANLERFRKLTPSSINVDYSEKPLPYLQAGQTKCYYQFTPK